ncbi:hypothetical protein [Halomicrobium urmianum]|uniref:hypothetical protein n=1 Tax=Halomicrobium urmianum TaxID=1586233 RepID=UPI001CD99962|nr:hypothetical protein [Halomicrobium urmianum]
MTSIKYRPKKASDRSRPPDTARRKSRLFCPACGFEGDAEEDWDHVSDAEGTAYVCPDCESVVARR